MMTREWKGKGVAGVGRASRGVEGDAQLEGSGAGEGQRRRPPGGGGSPAHRISPRRLPTPGAPAQITFAVRISKAAPGLFRSGNLILRGVYFSTLENSQCRTDPGRTHPAR